MKTLVLALLISNPPENRYVPQQPACQDPIRAQMLCDTAYELFDTGQQIEKRLNVCGAKLFYCEEKLRVRTATTTVHYIEKEEPTNWLIPTVVGVLGVVLGVVVGSQL